MTQAVKELRKYELMVIFSGDLTESDFEKELGEVRTTLKESTGGISHEDFWGKRDLAFRLKHQSRGYYVVFNFNATPEAIAELRMTVKLNQHILRHMLIIMDDDYVPTRFADMMAAPEEPRAEEKDRYPRRTISRPVPTAPVLEKKASTAEEFAGELKPKIAGKAEEDKLKSVEKKLDEILDNPDIDIK